MSTIIRQLNLHISKAICGNTTIWLQPRIVHSKNISIRHVSQSQSNGSRIGDELIKQVLKRNFPKASDIVVQDISGGCGAMFEVYVVSNEFKGMAKVKQHLAVSQALKNEIKDMHGIRIFTELPANSNVDQSAK
ncbi:BolA-like protein 3, partial [Blomia tropicalis]